MPLPPSLALCTGWGVTGYLQCKGRKLPPAEAADRAAGSLCLISWVAGALLGDRCHVRSPRAGAASKQNCVHLPSPGADPSPGCPGSPVLPSKEAVSMLVPLQPRLPSSQVLCLE